MNQLVNPTAFFDKVRPLFGGKLTQSQVDTLNAAIAAGMVKAAAPASSGEPAWLIEARKHVGMREIPGPKHNATILGWVKRLGGWFTDDETPWCGTFVAHCMDVAGIDRPKHWYRAKEWAAWGKPCTAVVGAIAVFGREGGGHVGFLVGQSADNYYVLGGNQSNMVNIMPLAKSRAIAIRWPAALPAGDRKLAAMTGGAVSRNEA